MKTIEELIRENKDFFEEAEPSKGHLDRFNTMLEVRFGKAAVKRSIVPYLLRAAVVTLLVTLSSLWVWDNYLSPGSKKMALGDVSPQYREVENYYLHQVNLMEGEINSGNLISNPEQKEMLLTEMKSMDSVYVSLQKELKANPNDQRVISAMIEHYQKKVDVMNYIISQLKAIRNDNENTTDNEKVSL
ncbi:MAG TPA: hypothetical protein VK155_11090 [Bacteroidales bacterium]|jgi:cytochrome c-type biogenesis protein CcmH/NrfG|nr:hypothetical protein [Bacteroidales bacterium]